MTTVWRVRLWGLQVVKNVQPNPKEFAAIVRLKAAVSAPNVWPEVNRVGSQEEKLVAQGKTGTYKGKLESACNLHLPFPAFNSDATGDR